MKAAIEEERDEFKLPRSILPNRVCVFECMVCIWSFSCACLYVCVHFQQHAALWFFFPPSVENLSHFVVVSERVGNLNAGIQIFFCDPLTGLQVTSSLQSLKNKTKKCNCPSVWGLDCARTQMEVQCLNFYLIHCKSVFFFLFFLHSWRKPHSCSVAFT